MRNRFSMLSKNPLYPLFLTDNIKLDGIPWNYNTNRNNMKKILCYMDDSDCRWFIVIKNAKIF